MQLGRVLTLVGKKWEVSHDVAKKTILVGAGAFLFCC